MFARLVGLFGSSPEFLRKAAVSFTLRFSGLFIQFIASLIVARLLGAEGFGAFTYAATWSVFIGMMLALGLGELSIREIPGYLARGMRGPLVGFLATVFTTIAITGTLAAILFAVLENAGILVLAPGWKLVALFAVVHGLVLTVSHALNGFQRVLTSQFLESILRQVLYLAMIGGVVLAGIALTPSRVFVISLLAAVPILFTMLWVLRRAWNQQVLGAEPRQFHLSVWIIGALPIFLTSFANRLQLDLDVLMVGAILGDFDVGIYRAAARGAILVSIANMIALQLVAPMLSRALAQDDREQAQKLLSQAALVSFALGMPIILVLSIGAQTFLGLFGPEFTQASTSLIILLVGQLTIVLAGADAILLIMLHRERLVMLVTGIGVALNFGLNLLLIGPMGINGAAIASMVSMAFVRIVLVLFVRRSTGFDTTVLSWLPVLGRRTRG